MDILGRFRGGDDTDDDTGGRPRRERGFPDDEDMHPMREVRELTRNGYSEEEITEILRDEGYTYGEINDALNEAVRESTVRTGSRRPQGGRMGQQQPPMERDAPAPRESFDQRPPQGRGRSGGFEDRGPDRIPRGDEFEEHAGQGPAPQERQQNLPPAPDQGSRPAADDYDEESWDSFESTPGEYPERSRQGPRFDNAQELSSEEEELIEIIVAEHFAEMEEEFDQVYAELDDLHETVERLENVVERVDAQETQEEEHVDQKINRIEERIDESDSRIGAMEKAMQQVLPALVENVRELSQLVREMKTGA